VAVKRLPIRLRVTLAFAAVMAVVLAAGGLLLHARMVSELDATIDRGLRSRAADVSALIRQADSGLAESGRSPLTEQGESLAEILDASGRVIDAPPALQRKPVLSRAEVRRALRGTTVFEHQHVPGGEDRTRLLATPVHAQGKPLVVVVGSSLEARDDAVSSLAALLAIGGPAALLFASLAGYGVAAAALRPVESMRRRASEIQASAPGQRLPVPGVRDEVSRLGNTLNAMLARLEAALARERTFVSDASHELRTPLSILKGELELAAKDGRTQSELQEAVRSAGEETDRLAQLAEDLLVIARSDQGELPLRLQSLPVLPLLVRVRDRFAQRATERGADIVVDAEEGLELSADGLRLEQALGNLVDNAIRHGGGPIVLSARPRGGAVELSVRDHGPGFPDAFIASAFERFTRSDHGRTGRGAGLGLAIVAAIAEGHGGTARAANRPPEGAVVMLVLPAGAG
jgi:two-component system OmpR family sensor kinase